MPQASDSRASASRDKAEPASRTGLPPGPLPEIPNCELLEVLGGRDNETVYSARQVDIERPVVARVLRADAHADDATRFASAARGQASLQHPHVVPVLDIGAADRHPYFVTEFVDGGSLERQIGGRPWPARDAARLVEVLARTIEYAHTHGVVHGDLHPGNVLLTSDGTPKVTGFGQQPRIAGEAGAPLRGTPGYLAPERAAKNALEASASADVYGLGAILYELLCGRPPFVAETPLETVRLNHETEPVAPIALNPRISPVINTICLTCLARNPARRYATAGDLADDLKRFVEDEPTVARPHGLLGKGRAMARRHPLLSTLAALYVVTSGSLLVVGAKKIFDQGIREKQLQAELDHVRSQGQLSDDNLRDAKATLDRLSASLAQEDVSSAPEANRARLRMLENARDFYSRFVRNNESNADQQVEAAAALVEKAEINRRLGNLVDASNEFQSVMGQIENLARGMPHSRQLRELIGRCYEGLSYTMLEQGKTLEARGLANSARFASVQLLEAEPKNVTYLTDLARIEAHLGHVLAREGKTADAIVQAERALGTFEQIGDDEKSRPDRVRKRAWYHDNWGQALAAAGEHDKASREYHEALRTYATLKTPPEGEYDVRFDVAKVQGHLAEACESLSQEQPAAEARREAVRLLEELHRDFRTVALYQNELASAHAQLARLLSKQGQSAEAETHQKRAAELGENPAADNGKTERTGKTE